MSNTEKSESRSSADLSDLEHRNLLDGNLASRHHDRKWPEVAAIASLLMNMVLLVAVAVLWKGQTCDCPADPSLGIWSPANGVVEYAEHHFRAALFNFTEYMGFPDDETDRRWQDLYNDYATSVISEEEAKNLITPTLRIPGTAKYLVQLDVFHELHCLNDMRKLLYPERFDGIQNLTAANGTVNRDTNMFRHWEHCVDSLRQTLMCHADVSPIPFHINRPMDSGIFPRLATTHTCRNFTKVQEWAREHSAGDFKYELELEEAREIAAESGFDNSPEEDIEFLYDQFPGDPFFKYWREHPLPTVGSSSTE